MTTLTTTKPLVTTELLEKVASDPEWTARVLAAAANALNTLAHRSQPDGFVRPGSEHFGARETLQHAFTDWAAVLDKLGIDQEVIG